MKTSWLFTGLAAIGFTVLLGGAALSGDNRNFHAHLSGDEEVPPNETRAQGQAIFHLGKDDTALNLTVNGDTALKYKLIVANISNVVAAHIHHGDEGVNGPIVAFLAGPFPAGGGRSDGILAQGAITAANLVGPLAGHPLSDLVTLMRNGETYVNVHTNDGVPPTNTGPGDFPGGEVRGQIE
ncbi:MAG: CHRD domain-containing protein [Deltaproteobacteria bacterium]|nr:CHRD domain-containing protein [Deltaproteobacteria bacterium]